MVTPARSYVTPGEYLDRERRADHKSEYHNGVIYAMAGASERHNVLCANLIRLFGNHLLGKSCRTYTSDMRVLVRESGLYTYPDVAVVCGRPEFADDKSDTLTNPLVIVEVVSPSTEAYDRGAKAAMYRERESVQAYVLVAHDRYGVEVYTRASEGQWFLTEVREPGESVTVEPIGCELIVDEVCDKVELSQSANYTPTTPGSNDARATQEN